MDKLETARLIKLMAGAWPEIKVTEDTIKSWHFLLKHENFKLACQAVASLAHSKSDSFIPKIQDLIREMKKIVCPNLFLSFEEADMRGSAIIRRARDQVYGKVKEYNPYGNPKEQEFNAYQTQAQERAVKATYESLRSSLEQRPVNELWLISQGKRFCLQAGREDLVDILSSPAQRQSVLPSNVMRRLPANIIHSLEEKLEEGQNG